MSVEATSSADDVVMLHHWIGAQVLGQPDVERRNPANPRDVVACSPSGDAETVAIAVDAATTAQPAWAAMTPPARGAILLRAASILQTRHAVVTRDLVREEGKTFVEATGEVERAIEILQYYGGEGRRGRGELLPSSVPHTLAYTRREPLGVVGIITPWNFPIAIPTWKSAPALVSGNAVILKPAELTPLSAWHLAEALSDAGMPAGVFNLVFGAGSTVGRALVSHRQVAAVSFTGSNAVGREIEGVVNARRGRVQLEMGGKNPLVVLDDADPLTAARIAADGAFGVTGQACTATSRVICTPGIHQAFLEAFVAAAREYRTGDGLDPSTRMGPVVSEEQLRKDLDWIAIARDEGATTSNEIRQVEKFLDPVILSGVHPTHRVAQEEVFGPIVSVLAAEDMDHAIDVANDIPFGLSAGVITNDMRHANHFIDRAQAGIVKINRTTSGVDPNVPFGGVKESSTNMYREQGSAAADFYTWSKSVYLGMAE